MNDDKKNMFTTSEVIGRDDRTIESSILMLAEEIYDAAHHVIR
jgi:hypothetical protein